MLTRLFPLALALAWLLCACEGPTGPLGPEGPPGIAGPSGERVPPGALDISSHDVLIVPSEFDDDNNQEIAIYNIPSITEQVVTEGAVLAYTNLGVPGDFWFALPISEGSYQLGFGFAPGLGILTINRPEGSPPAAAHFRGYRVRFLAFQPSGTAVLKQVDREDYEAIVNWVPPRP